MLKWRQWMFELAKPFLKPTIRNFFRFLLLHFWLDIQTHEFVRLKNEAFKTMAAKMDMRIIICSRLIFIVITLPVILNLNDSYVKWGSQTTFDITLTYSSIFDSCFVEITEVKSGSIWIWIIFRQFPNSSQVIFTKSRSSGSSFV